MNLLKTNWEDFGLFLLDKAITILLISILFFILYQAGSRIVKRLFKNYSEQKWTDTSRILTLSRLTTSAIHYLYCSRSHWNSCCKYPCWCWYSRSCSRFCGARFSRWYYQWLLYYRWTSNQRWRYCGFCWPWHRRGSKNCRNSFNYSNWRWWRNDFYS